ncbi:hypothetical protein [Albibacillus kandeliae]|uniref:hypothetical protein n=1 Tax=Albibacillus kandeliae TaxID=2174228 RepID=UPI000D68DC47|nr:hypothetical protein [Albibacillus kandeliae]
MIAYDVQPNLVGAILAGEITAVVWPNSPMPHARVGDDIRLCLGLRGPETITLLIAPCTGSEEIRRTDAVRSSLMSAPSRRTSSVDRTAMLPADPGRADGGLRAWRAARQVGGDPHHTSNAAHGFTRISWDFARASHVASAAAFDGVDEATLSRGLQ